MTTIKTFVQKTNDLIAKNNLDYSTELFNQILKSVMNDENNSRNKRRNINFGFR